MALDASPAHTTITSIFRGESVKLVARLMRLVRDVGLAEELAQDALVSALERWPSSGVPDNPGAWLMATAKNRALDTLRRHKLQGQKHEALGVQLALEGAAMPAPEAALDDDIDDDLVRLIFTACHPVLPREAQVALTLRLLGGLTTEEIARAFLVPTSTIAQRIVRAKRALADGQVPYEVPAGPARRERLQSVLEVLYLVFNEGYSATAGDDWMRPALCDDAIRMARVVAELMPDEPEVFGLLALLLIQASRAAARVGPQGEPILLLAQDRTRWDQALLQAGLLTLARAQSLCAAAGPYTLQAAIAGCHARAVRAEDTDWVMIAQLYEELVQQVPSPVVELNRAVAVSMAWGPAHGLALADALLQEPSLAQYHLLPAVRADFLDKLGRHTEAEQELRRAASLTRNARERALLTERADQCASRARALVTGPGDDDEPAQ